MQKRSKFGEPTNAGETTTGGNPYYAIAANAVVRTQDVVAKKSRLLLFETSIINYMSIYYIIYIFVYRNDIIINIHDTHSKDSGGAPEHSQSSMNVMTSILVCLLLIFATGDGDTTLSSKPNENWRCTGCANNLHTDSIYGAIRSALRRANQAPSSFLSIDMSWTQFVLERHANVHVQILNCSVLATVILNHVTDEEFHIVVAESTGFFKTWGRSRIDSYRSYLQHFLDVPLFPDVDNFLVNNPCYVPLNEPTSRAPKITKTNAQNHDPSQGGRRLTDKFPKHSTDKQDRRYRHGQGQGALSTPKLLILVRLPAKIFRATCMLFSALTARQFPSGLGHGGKEGEQTASPGCVYDADHMIVHKLSNIGFAHTANAALYSFVYLSLIQGEKARKVFTMPISEEFMARRANLAANLTDTDAWAWAEPSTCPLIMQLHDPWACNFLPITSCSNRFLSEHIPAESWSMWQTPTAFLRSANITEPLRKAQADRDRGDGDGPLLTQERWAMHRIKAFMQRPNMWLRMLIRQSMLTVQSLTPAPSDLDSSILPNLPCVHADAVPPATIRRETGTRLGTEGDSTDRERYDLRAGDVLQIQGAQGRDHSKARTWPTTPHARAHAEAPSGSQWGPWATMAGPGCIAVHVRHNDVWLEAARSASKVDRSLAAHVSPLRTLAQALGTCSIFLATDNATNVHHAATLYPEFTWWVDQMKNHTKPFT